MTIKIPVSPGELIDKITILEIKSELIKDSKKLSSASYELKRLNKELDKIFKQYPKLSKDIRSIKKKLHGINLNLWNTEDKIRKFEAEKDFGQLFVGNARKIYALNDLRSEYKNVINKLLGSRIHEVKQYEEY